MKAAHYKVNIVPVIAKADTLTKIELTKLKKKVWCMYTLDHDNITSQYTFIIDHSQCSNVIPTCTVLFVYQILEEIRANGINIYTLPDCDEDEDEEFKQQCDQLKVKTATIFCLALSCEAFNGPG